MKTSMIKSLAFLSLISVSAFSSAALITSDAGYTGPSLDLTAYENGMYNFTFGPEFLPGGITLTAAPGGGGNSGMGSVIGQGNYGLGANGTFGGDAVYIGVDSGTGYAELTFDTEVSSFGAFINYAPRSGDDPTIWALDEFGNIIESWNLEISAPISTPGGFNDFAFRGIDLGANTFKTFRFGGSYILLTGTSDGRVIEANSPTIFGLLGIALVALGYRKVKKSF